MEKILVLICLASISVQVFCVNLRYKRQSDGSILIDQDGIITPQDEIETENNVQNQRECLRSCPVTAEYNPVCGSDNVTYPNPGRLICAQACGVNVTLVRQGRCPVATPAPN